MPIQSKIDRARTILCRILASGRLPCKHMITELNEIEVDLHIMNDTGQLINRVDSLMSTLQIGATQLDNPIMFALIDTYWSISAASAPAILVDCDRCQYCSSPYEVVSDRSELSCASCGASYQLYGAIFEDAQLFSQECQRTKTGFSPNRHFQFWMLHILAKEPDEEIGDKNDVDNLRGTKTIERLRALIKQDSKPLMRLTVYDIRKLLKILGMTEMNKNVSLILRKLTGVGPPGIRAYFNRLEKLFSVVIRIQEQIRGPTQTNRSFYCYYIYKILDSIIPAKDRANRRILYYIYMQGERTIQKKDDEWMQICEQLPGELVYRRTDRLTTIEY